MDDSLKVPNPTIPADMYDGLIEPQTLEATSLEGLEVTPRYYGDKLVVEVDDLKYLFMALGKTSDDWHLIYSETDDT